jgi:hypothetical protein
MASSNGDKLDNIYSMESERAIDLIKTFFSYEYFSLKVKSEYIDPSGYWGIIVANDKIEVSVSSGRGFLEWSVKISGREIDLTNYEAEVRELKTSSKKNIEFLLQVVGNVIKMNESTSF